jgi:hypothetical protein
MHSSTQASPTHIEIAKRRSEMRAKALRKRIRNLELQIAVFIVVVGTWEVLAATNTIDPFFFSQLKVGRLDFLPFRPGIWRPCLKGYFLPRFSPKFVLRIVFNPANRAIVCVT